MNTIGQVLSNLLVSLRNPESEIKNKLVDEWGKIAGPQIASHTKPWLKKNGQLCVWVDQSTLAFELNQKYKQSLLKRTQAVLGEEQVTSIFIRVGEIR